LKPTLNLILEFVGIFN